MTLEGRQSCHVESAQMDLAKSRCHFIPSSLSYSDGNTCLPNSRKVNVPGFPEIVDPVYIFF